MGCCGCPASRPAVLVLFALAAFLPATEVATALVNRAVTWSFGAMALPGLELAAAFRRSCARWSRCRRC